MESKLVVAGETRTASQATAVVVFYDLKRVNLSIASGSEAFIKSLRKAIKSDKIDPLTVRKPNSFYRSPENRANAIKWMMFRNGMTDARDLSAKDFRANGLGALLTHIYHGHVYPAAREVAPDQNIQPWEMGYTPRKFYGKPANRVKAIHWLSKKLNKHVNELDAEDFHNNRLGGLLTAAYGGSIVRARKEALAA